MSNFLFQSGGAASVSDQQWTQDVGLTQAVAQGLSFGHLDSGTYKEGELRYHVHRTTTGNTAVGEVGRLLMFLNPETNAWNLSRSILQAYGATINAGLSFQINNSGLVSFTANAWIATGYSGSVTYQFLSKMKG